MNSRPFPCDLNALSSTYQAFVEAAKTKPSEREDFAHLKDTCPEVYDEVKKLVANEAGDAITNIILKEFPYQVSERLAML